MAFTIVILSIIIYNCIEANISNIKISLYLSIVAVLFSYSTIYLQGTRSHRQEEIRLIEKRLDNFYLPLHNLFIGYEQNPMDRYQEQKTKFLEIGCYSHLAEKEAFELFDKCQDDDSLIKLIDQVRKDINMLQNKYKEKTKDKGFFS
ncbi:hypothetical protein SDC9_91994 [bioreactor metagenome]|uniref:Uncharacterized protein n=1 Tax=bioreactor metagenome TaxID=1076179 RepID=A0A644ZY05_9ZZZZ